jgi:hypothetical protein
LKHLIPILLILPFILGNTSCATVKADVPVETPAIPAATSDTENPGMTHEDEMRYAQIIILINQLCGVDNEINKDCRGAVIKCYGTDLWAPTPKILHCFDDWGKP